jgi:hypothetical protein
MLLHLLCLLLLHLLLSLLLSLLHPYPMHGYLALHHCIRNTLPRIKTLCRQHRPESILVLTVRHTLWICHPYQRTHQLRELSAPLLPRLCDARFPLPHCWHCCQGPEKWWYQMLRSLAHNCTHAPPASHWHDPHTRATSGTTTCTGRP